MVFRKRMQQLEAALLETIGTDTDCDLKDPLTTEEALEVIQSVYSQVKAYGELGQEDDDINRSLDCGVIGDQNAQEEV